MSRISHIATIAVAGLFTYCSTTPVTDRTALSLVPDAQVQTMGKDAFSQILVKEKTSTDAERKSVLVRVGTRIAKASGANYNWEFELFDAPKTVNAFCLPGGKIGVYSGILSIAKTEAGLAAILGHEVAHATAKHANERISQGLVLQLGMQVADLSLGNGAAAPYIMGALGLGAQIGVMLPFSRLHESEADRIGLTYMAKAGYDPQEAVGLWERMAKQGQAPFEFLATHPNPLNRAEAIRSDLAKVSKDYDASEKQPSHELF